MCVPRRRQVRIRRRPMRIGSIPPPGRACPSPTDSDGSSYHVIARSEATWQSQGSAGGDQVPEIATAPLGPRNDKLRLAVPEWFVGDAMCVLRRRQVRIRRRPMRSWNIPPPGRACPSPTESNGSSYRVIARRPQADAAISGHPATVGPFGGPFPINCGQKLA